MILSDDKHFTITALSSLDGRYKKITHVLSEYYSEYSLIKTRIEVEIKYLLHLSKSGIIRQLNPIEKRTLYLLYESFLPKDALLVKEFEEKTRHDVKAAEQYLRSKFSKTSLSDVLEMIHYGLTSEDINNISYRLMVNRANKKIFSPKLNELLKHLVSLSSQYKNTPMLARTHGQPAVPTTLGKEVSVFALRLAKQLNNIKKHTLYGKCNGAVGNFNALSFSFSNTDWITLSSSFISSLGLQPDQSTTQINPYDDLVELFQIYQRINNILIGLDQDIWRYISDGWFYQEVKKGEVGSSTMPQKVNPIDFENSEGNLGLANALFEFYCRKLPISRLQRDLSDSTVLRTIGIAFGHSFIGYNSIIVGLTRISPNTNAIEKGLLQEWSILTEAAQILLRKEGIDDAYIITKDMSRGKNLNEKSWKQFIKKLPISDKNKKTLLSLRPNTYIGLSKKLTEWTLKEVEKN